MGGAASPSIVPRCTLWKVRCKLFLVKPARPAQSTAVPRYLLVQAVSLLGSLEYVSSINFAIKFPCKKNGHKISPPRNFNQFQPISANFHQFVPILSNFPQFYSIFFVNFREISK